MKRDVTILFVYAYTHFACYAFQVVYVTAVVPYIVLIILLIWNAQLEGAWLGVKFYVIPEWSKLGTAKVRLGTTGLTLCLISTQNITREDCLSIEARPPTNSIHRHAFLLL